jgi:hypothetical protein
MLLIKKAQPATSAAIAKRVSTARFADIADQKSAARDECSDSETG